MQIVADLHLHSKYSRAVSPQMTLPVMADFARKKGIDLLTASDWTHPLWFKEIEEKLEETSEGIYTLKSLYAETSLKPIRFLLSTEISCIYKQDDKLRRIHTLVFVPNMQTAQKVTQALLDKGANLSADGRPIIGMSARNLLELILEADERSMLVPCHAWTPHFGIYGSASGFDSLDEAFGDLAPYVYGVETGISSDPAMNWQIPELRNRSILSFSDAHSAPKMGREATVFVSKDRISNDKYQLSNVTYEDIRKAIMRKGEKLEIGYTIEFYPEEGKYHYSGHRACKVSYGPEKIQEKGTTCPVCRKQLTEGVFRRVQTVAGMEYKPRSTATPNEQGVMWYTDPENKYPGYVKLVPLLEVVAEGMGVTTGSKKAQLLYEELLTKLGSELTILLQTPISDIRSHAGVKVAESVSRMRLGTIAITPGYDGEYGKVRIWNEGEEPEDTSQLRLL